MWTEAINWDLLSKEEVAFMQFAFEREYDSWRKEHHDEDAPTQKFWAAIESLSNQTNKEWNKRKLKYEMFVVGPTV
jgi:hypothetical protein